jgi:hypothetical protein
MLAAGSLLAADPKDDVTSAANALADQPNYSWTTTTENGGGGGGFNRGPTNGKTEKDGYTTLSMSFGDNTMEAVIKGTNGAIKTPDNGWQSLAEAQGDGGGGGGFNPGMMIARTISNFKSPSAEAVQLAGETKGLTAGANGITGDLTDDAIKSMMVFRRGRNNPNGDNGGGPTISNGKGTVTFSVTDGKLTKYVVHVSGTVSFNGNDRDIDRTTTTEIKDIGSTKVTVDDDAKKKLQ